MPTYEENRSKIKEKLYEFNSTLDREDAYNATVDYIMGVAIQSWREAAREYGWENDEIESEIRADLYRLGLIPPAGHERYKTKQPDQEDGNDEAK